ncbi:class I SAM-dependent methyltransferase [Sphingomonas sp. PAMC 26605]|uniref:class I SAM-dependent methyltransferase n=1 Tax=Sphingomonas sp. PAMC 26605 TaxID=1112214 RepID=UPI0012F4B7E7|nr:class I SAM-dependent methyltransferase [Sphingomonas sp. PAMC 26605]
MVRAVRLVRAMATPLGRGRLEALWHGARLYQPATVTRPDRHPALFAYVAALLGDRADVRLLSFGCSTGEEPLTLACYLPHARIDAIDANPACIARAKRSARADAPTIRFACADRPDAFAGTRYDAVFCLSVLRHGDLEAKRPPTCTDLLPFARFAEAVDALDRCLGPGGLLVLWGCNFRFADSPVAAGYRALTVPGQNAQPGPFYGPDDQLLPIAESSAFLFVKAG